MDAIKYRKIVGNKIRLLREIRGLSQMDLAYGLGYNSTGAISQIESGARGMGKLKTLEAAGILGIHPAILMSGIEFDKEQLKMFSDLTTIIEKAPDSDHLKTIKFLIESAIEHIKKDPS
jgi:transcriptional regulator with XRE-family HTH domain